VDELAPGLWRWTARHPEWRPEEDSLPGYEPVGASIAYRAAGGLVLVDPLLEDGGAVWAQLDRLVEEAGRPPDVLVTILWHTRSAGAVTERYPGTRVWAHEPARDAVAERGPVTDIFRPGDDLPGGIHAIDAGRAWEVLFWLPEQAALVPGDVLLGLPEGGGLRLCPDEWLGVVDRAGLVEGLRARLLELPVERVLVSHGEPLLQGGRDALERALA
jgi:hypothetical protein